jgi:hypothetical protein
MAAPLPVERPGRLGAPGTTWECLAWQLTRSTQPYGHGDDRRGLHALRPRPLPPLRGLPLPNFF